MDSLVFFSRQICRGHSVVFVDRTWRGRTRACSYSMEVHSGAMRLLSTVTHLAKYSF
jgi:hypothetical protein